MALDTSRVTSLEACKLLGAHRPHEAVRLLHAANVAHSRAGTAYLWDRHGVERLAAALSASLPKTMTGEEGRAHD